MSREFLHSNSSMCAAICWRFYHNSVWTKTHLPLWTKCMRHTWYDFKCTFTACLTYFKRLKCYQFSFNLTLLISLLHKTFPMYRHICSWTHTYIIKAQTQALIYTLRQEWTCTPEYPLNTNVPAIQRSPFVEVRKEVKENWGKHDLIYAIHLDYLFIRAHSNY